MFLFNMPPNETFQPTLPAHMSLHIYIIFLCEINLRNMQGDHFEISLSPHMVVSHDL